MGWNSANEIFDPIAQVTADLPHEVRLPILARLISKLQENDWDTEDESLEQFRHDPTIVAAFYLNGIGTNLGGDDEEYGFIGYGTKLAGWSPSTDLAEALEPGWFLHCYTHGRFGTDEFTAEGHNGLLTQWVQHEAAEHDGSGDMDTVADHMIGEPGSALPVVGSPAGADSWPVEVTGVDVTVVGSAAAEALVELAVTVRDFVRAGGTAGMGASGAKLRAALVRIPEGLL